MQYKTNRLTAGIIIGLLTFVQSLQAEDTSSSGAAEKPVNLVNPLIGSDNSSNWFMTAAVRPFGMVKLRPDTQIMGFLVDGL